MTHEARMDDASKGKNKFLIDFRALIIELLNIIPIRDGTLRPIRGLLLLRTIKILGLIARSRGATE